MRRGSKEAMLLASMIAMCPEAAEFLPSLPSPKPEPAFTSADAERLAKAEAKRQRKAARRVHLAQLARK